MVFRIISRSLCLVVLVLEIKGLSLSFRERRWNVLIYYTQISNIAAALSSALLLVFDQPVLVRAVRYVSTCMLIMTLLITVFVLIPMGGNAKKLLWSGNGLYHHVLCPVISSVSYIIFESHASAGMIWIPVAVTAVYGGIMLYLNWIRYVDGPYPFFHVHKQSVLATVLWTAALLAVIAAVSALVWLVGGTGRI